MPAGDVNNDVLHAVLRVFEAWMEEDRAAASLANGVLSEPERHRAVSQARQKNADALLLLQTNLPPPAHADLVARLQALTPRSDSPVGATARVWAKPEHRLATARALLKSAAAVQRAADERGRAQRRAAQAERDRQAALLNYRSQAERVFDEDFIGADAWFTTWDTGGAISKADFESWKAQFVQSWAKSVLNDEHLDRDQAQVVATTSGDLRVVARAGSGKTRTLVTRALFLQRHCGVDPGSILLVAFNRKAVTEIRERILDGLPTGAPPPHVVTFHALAYALLRPDEDLVFDDEDAQSHAQSAKVQSAIDDFLLERTDDVRRAMLGFFREDWERIRQRGLHLQRDDFFATRAEVTRVTLGGEYVKSFGERLIANTLFENGVEYRYERNFPRGGFNYRPDFTILANGKPRLVIEYFGMTRDPGYEQNAEAKRTFWKSQTDLTFVEFTPTRITSMGQDHFQRLLLEALDSAGMPHRPLTEDEIWERVRRRAVDTFSKALRALVNRARQLNLTPEDLRIRTQALVDPAANVCDFLELAADVYQEYLARAASEGYEDFNGVLWRAAECVRAGSTAWTRAGGKERGDLTALRFIHVDEFQDFSLMFMEFIQAIREQSPDASLCCVGDDWQAINGFAGADLRFFEGFEGDFPGSITRRLTTNYRSPTRIVSAGNAVMAGRGEPALPFRSDPGHIQVARLDSFRPSPRERERFPGDIGTPALLRLLKQALTTSEGTVGVLFRRNTVPWFTNSDQGPFGRRLDGYAKYLQRDLASADAERIELTTAHKYKGREADFIIVADADEKSYPLIHPTAELFEIFGDTVERLVDEERRLFYVSTTRAEQHLCYLVTSNQPSPFLAAVETHAAMLRWENLAEGVAADATCVEIRVYDAYEIRETLKERFGFKFDEHTKTWYVLRPAKDFDFRAVRRTLAFIGPRLIEVRDSTHRVVHQAGARLEGF